MSICDRIVDLGWQKSSYLGKEKVMHKMYWRFQTPAKRVKFERDGKEVNAPAVIGATLTLSMSEKANLRAYVEGWRGQAFRSDQEAEQFDILTLLGKPCMLSVVHDEKDGKTYANIKSISGLPDGATAPKMEGDAFAFHDEDKSHENDLPEWIREKLSQRVQPPHKPKIAANVGNAVFEDDDIPF